MLCEEFIFLWMTECYSNTGSTSISHVLLPSNQTFQSLLWGVCFLSILNPTLLTIPPLKLLRSGTQLKSGLSPSWSFWMALVSWVSSSTSLKASPLPGSTSRPPKPRGEIWSKTSRTQFNQNPTKLSYLLNIAIKTAWLRNWLRGCSMYPINSHYQASFSDQSNHC